MTSRPFDAMKRREFMELAIATLAAGAGACASGGATSGAQSPAAQDITAGPPSPPAGPLDAAAFRAARRVADISFGKIAYVERGSGEAALFLHGCPLNGLQWRGAVERLSPLRRCVVPDFMGLGYTEVSAGQSVRASAQAEMLAAFLDALSISKVDIVASDSGGAAAQLFMVRYPQRVRTMLLTNCDTEPNSPPPGVQPVIAMARAGTLADSLAKWLVDPQLARSTFGKAVYRDPNQLTDDVIDYYFAPLVSSPLKRAKFHEFNVDFEPNPLAGIEASLARSQVPTRIVWGAADDLFAQSAADYLDRTLAQSRGVRRVPGAKLFFQEEFPDIIAEEARALWADHRRHA